MNIELEASTASWCRRWDPGVLFLLFLPLIFLWLNDNWIFNFPGWADQWIYFGNHEGLLRKLKLFADSYRVNRFSWDLPGALCYALLPPLAARLVFHLAFYYAAALSFYAVAKRTLGRRAALFGALFLEGYPLFLTSMGWDYVDGACQTYFLLTLFCVMKGAEWDAAWRKGCLFLAGVFFAAGMYCYPLTLFFGPIAIGLFLLIWSDQTRAAHAESGFAESGLFTRILRARLMSAFAIAGAGFVGLTLVFCLVFYYGTGKFFFFMTSIKFTGSFIKLKDVNPAPDGWLATATWVVVPAAVLVVCIAALSAWFCRRARLDSAGRAALFFALAHVGLFLAFSACQIWLRLPCIRIMFYISFLTPITFLALAGVLRPTLDRLSPAAWVALLASLIVLLAAPLLPVPRSMLAQVIGPTAIWSAGAMACGLLLLTIVIGGRRLSFGCVYALAVAAAFDSVNSPRVFEGLSFPNRDIHLAFAQSHQVLRAIWPDEPYRFWFPLDDPLSREEVYFSLAISTSVGNASVVSNRFPTRDDWLGVSGFVMTAGDKVVVLSNEDIIVERANASLAPLRLVARGVAEKRIQQGKVAYTMTFLQIDAAPTERIPPPETGQARLSGVAGPEFSP